ncbi:MAG: tRNA (adenosine(37)-N6)-threonylcarbamoyltransferase complex dimerization subunit type 1 TsaB [Cyanobacteria bacterium J06638_28]
MIGLAIHTSSPELGLAIVDNTGHVRSEVWPLGRDLSSYLHDRLIHFLPPHQWTELTFLAVAQGPGGFTGTRIGVVAARTLAQQLAIPLFGISSLAAIAHQTHHANPKQHSRTASDDIAVKMRAQRGETFGAIYRCSEHELISVLDEKIYTQADWHHVLESWEKPCHLIAAEGGLAASVSGILALAQAQWLAGDRPNWQTVLPFYGQHPVR